MKIEHKQRLSKDCFYCFESIKKYKSIKRHKNNDELSWAGIVIHSILSFRLFLYYIFTLRNYNLSEKDKVFVLIPTCEDCIGKINESIRSVDFEKEHLEMVVHKKFKEKNSTGFSYY
jgi:hypothetical protein